MIATFAGVPLLELDTTETFPGRFQATVVFADKPPTQGYLETEGAKIFGTLTQVAPVNGLWAASFFAGFGGWSNPIESQAMRGPLQYSDVVKRIAASVGETIAFTASADRQCESYTVTAGPALSVIEGDWFVRDDGVTSVGSKRTGVVRTTDTVRIIEFPSNSQASGISDILLRAGDTVPTFDGTAVLTEVHMSLDGTFTASIKGAPSLRDVFTLATAPRTLYKSVEYKYNISDATLISDAGSPPIPIPRVWIGPGVSATFAQGTPMSLAYFDGDRGRPIVLSCGPDVPPTQYRINAATVKLGPTAAEPLAVASSVIAALQALATTCTTQSTTVGGAGASSAALAIATAAALTALAAALSAATLAPIQSKTIFGDL